MPNSLSIWQDAMTFPAMPDEEVPLVMQQCFTPDRMGVSLPAMVSLFQTLAFGLHLADDAFVARQTPMPLPSGDVARSLRERMKIEGFFQVKPKKEDWGGLPLDAMRDLVVRLVEAGIPPVFAFVFDEFWLAYAKLRHVIAVALADTHYWQLPDFWVWHVRADAGEAGWDIHRDLGVRSLRPDGDAGAISVWIPLTYVDSFTGCMMLVPKDRDPEFGSGLVLQSDLDLRDIRALHGHAGDVMVWSQALMHWGSRGSGFSEQPRISMSMGMQRSDHAPFNQPLLRADILPRIGLRLELIAKQLLQYEKAAGVAPSWAQFARVTLASKLSELTYDLPPEWRLPVYNH